MKKEIACHTPLTRLWHTGLTCLLLGIGAGLTASCSDDNEPEDERPTLSVATTTYTLAAEEGSQSTVNFEVNVAWSATVDYAEGESTQWLTLSPASGEAGKATLTLTAAANPNPTERTASIRLDYADQSQVLSVTQAGSTTQGGDEPGTDEPDGTDITADFDPAFAQALQTIGIVADATHITAGEVKNVTTLDVNGQLLTSLKGIEHFAELTSLNCLNNQLTSLVLSNPKLTEVNCNANAITELNLSGCPVLSKLECQLNSLGTLDLTGYRALTHLNCDYTGLTELNIGVCPTLTYLNCGDNELTSLDLSQNGALTFLAVSNTTLTELDLTGCTQLANLTCVNNRLTGLDITPCPNLSSLMCQNNPGADGVFVVKAWFDNDNVPNSYFTTGSWTYGEQTVTIDYQMP